MWFVFDVESDGLHGEAFAYGFVVVDDTGADVEITDAWVREHVVPANPRATCGTRREVRLKFWDAWVRWKERGAVMVADCAWPVEARFLAACVDDYPLGRPRDGPYPLHDVATMRLAAGLDPLATEGRLLNEMPIHNPLADARQSARLWLEALATLRNGGKAAMRAEAEKWASIEWRDIHGYDSGVARGCVRAAEAILAAGGAE
jgi:hypothetical protein